MRASSVVRSGMPDGHKWIGWYGHFGGPTQKYIKTYGVLKGYLFNGFRRTVANLPYSGIPFVVGYFVYTWGNQEFGYVNSKAGHIAHGGDHE